MPHYQAYFGRPIDEGLKKLQVIVNNETTEKHWFVVDVRHPFQDSVNGEYC